MEDALALVFSRLASEDPSALQRAAQTCSQWWVAGRATSGYCGGRLIGSAAEGRRSGVEALAYIPPREGSHEPAPATTKQLPPSLIKGRGWPATLAAGCTDGSSRLWGVENKTCLSEIPLPPSAWMGCAVYALAYLPSQGWVAGGSYDSSIKLWDLESRLEVGILRGHRTWVNALLYLPHLDWLASGSGDSRVLLHCPETRTIVGVIDDAQAAIHGLALLTDLLARYLQKSVTCAVQRRARGSHTPWDLTVCACSLSACADNSVKIWQLPSPVWSHNVPSNKSCRSMIQQ